MSIHTANRILVRFGATLQAESEAPSVNNVEIIDSAESFSIECWYRTALLRLLVEDLAAGVTEQKIADGTPEIAQQIRACESSLSSFLGRNWSGRAGDLARKNRSRLRVFDLRVGEGIENPIWLDLESLAYTLKVWQRRIMADQPTLLQRLKEQLYSEKSIHDPNVEGARETGGDWGRLPELLKAWQTLLRTAGNTKAADEVSTDEVTPRIRGLLADSQ